MLASNDEREKRTASVLLMVAAASALFWLVHSFAVRSLFAAIRLAASKLGH